MRSLVPLALAALAAQAVQTPKAPLPRGAEALDFMEVVWDMNSDGDLVPTIRVTGANVQIVNGGGSSITPTPNGRGNLILGYNESDGSQAHSGSHNLVIGPGHSYWGSASIVHGQSNRIYSDGAATIGGWNNVVEPEGSVIVAGSSNRTEMLYGEGSAIIAGAGNMTRGGSSAIVGGWGNSIGESSEYSTITGGSQNSIAHDIHNASISGGKERSIPQGSSADYDWAAGSLYEDD